MSSYRMKYKIGQVEHHIPVSDDLQDIDLDDKFDLDSDWCYIYPNNGTAANPASIAINSCYIENNPFPGYYVRCLVEFYYEGQWGTAIFSVIMDSAGKEYGVNAFVEQHNGGGKYHFDYR